MANLGLDPVHTSEFHMADMLELAVLASHVI